MGKLDGVWVIREKDKIEVNFDFWYTLQKDRTVSVKFDYLEGPAGVVAKLKDLIGLIEKEIEDKHGKAETENDRQV